MEAGMGKESGRQKRTNTEVGHITLSLTGGGYLLLFNSGTVTSIMIKVNSGGKGFISSYKVQFIIQRSQGRNSTEKPWRVTAAIWRAQTPA